MDSEEKAQWVDALVQDPCIPRPESVAVEEWRDVQQLATMERLLASRGAPPVDEDPVAAFLGLVPDSAVVVDGPQFKRLRGRSSVSEIAARLQEYGWDVSSGEVRRWQSSEGVALPPALVGRLAKLLGATAAQITRRVDSGADERVAQDPRWEAAVARLAKLLNIGPGVAQTRLRGVVAGAAFRNASSDSLVEAAEAYVAQLEKNYDI